MTLNDVQRAALALFAARAAGEGGSLEQMKAIAYCIRNRVKAGWWNGEWLTVMEQAREIESNHERPPYRLNPNDRTLQRLVADIDDVYYGGRDGRPQESKPMPAQQFRPQVEDLETSIGNCFYWCWVNHPFTPWFQAQILDRPNEHPNRAQMGMMAFFE